MRIRGFGNVGLGFSAPKRKKRVRSRDDGCALNIKCPTRFSLTELRRATNDFSETHIIGLGSYGKIYKAMLDNGQMVAIKMVGHGWRKCEEFTAEVALLSRLRHNNLLDLIGFCVERGKLILVSDYIANGSLRYILFGNTEIQLDWRSRVGIALQSARALAYLHNDANPGVIHGDIRPTSILVDENLTAKVTNLGLAKILPGEPNDGDSHVSTEVSGTLGYLDTGKLSVKSDVFSLGIVLLQLITRRPAFDLNADDKTLDGCVDHTLKRRGIRGLKEELMDPLLRDSLLVGFERFLSLALTCVWKFGSQRPSMREVVRELESILDMDIDIDIDISMSMEMEREMEMGGFS